MKKKATKRGRVTRRTTAAERETLLQEYEASGLSRREFAERKGINLLTFHCWFSKRLENQAGNRPLTKFVKVALPDAAKRTITVVAESSSGLRIRIEGLGLHEIASLLREVPTC